MQVEPVIVQTDRTEGAARGRFTFTVSVKSANINQGMQMNKRILPVSLLLSVLLCPVAAPSFSPKGLPSGEFESPGGGAFFTGNYDNLFADLLGKSEADINRKIGHAFDQLFFGNGSTQRVYYVSNSDSSMAYIEDIGNGDVRTEGMSYGMMIAVQMNRKDVFDKIWKWAKTYMQVKSGPHEGYFAWHCKTDGTIIDPNAASDGEEWFVTALLFASGRWGNGTGIFDYEMEANQILNTMLHKEGHAGHGRITDMFDRREMLVVFVPEMGANEFTDPSYQVPHFYELWSRWAEHDNEFWKEAAAASRRLLKKAANAETGLFPDYSHFDGTPVRFWPGGHSDFRFDAWRVAMNIAVDHEWYGNDEWEVEECNKLLNFFSSQGRYGNQYTLDGKQLGKDHSTGLVAMNAVAALASTNENRKAFVEELWNASVPSGFYRYYDGMLYILGLLQVSGNFRVYVPADR